MINGSANEAGMWTPLTLFVGLKALELDGLSPALLKDRMRYRGRTGAFILQSMGPGKVPLDWTESIVIPLLKRDYRPICGNQFNLVGVKGPCICCFNSLHGTTSWDMVAGKYVSSISGQARVYSKSLLSPAEFDRGILSICEWQCP